MGFTTLWVKKKKSRTVEQQEVKWERVRPTKRIWARVSERGVEREEPKEIDTIAIIKAEDEVTAGGTWCDFNSPEIWPASHQPFNSALSWLPPHLTKNLRPHTHYLPNITLTKTFFGVGWWWGWGVFEGKRETVRKRAKGVAWNPFHLCVF